jgi:hypothetical protein
MKIYNAAGTTSALTDDEIGRRRFRGALGGSLEGLRVPGVGVNARGTSITRGSSILGGRRLDYL